MSNNCGTAVARTVRRVALTAAGIAGAGQDDPRTPEPTNLTGMLIGYSPMSMSGQNPSTGQTRAMTDVGRIQMFASKLPCKTAPSSPLAWITFARATP